MTIYERAFTLTASVEQAGWSRSASYIRCTKLYTLLYYYHDDTTRTMCSVLLNEIRRCVHAVRVSDGLFNKS